MSSQPLPRRIELLGHSPWTPERILSEIEAGLPPAEAPGCFTLVAEDGASVTIATSAMSALLYCYHLSADRQRLAHGRTVFDVVRRAALPWRWSRSGLRAFMLIDQTLGEETLHDEIRHVPPGALLRFRPGSFSCRGGPGPASLFQRAAPPAAQQAAETLRAAVDDAAGGPAFVALTAGHDSRMVLAALLAAGHRPVTVTIGPAACEDRRVAESIARDLGLEHRAVEMTPDLYLTHARSAVRLTGGGKGPAHWHMHLLCQEAEIPPGALHYLGINGEFARTNYFDKGLLALLADRQPFDLARGFLRAKVAARRHRAPWMAAPWCRPILEGALPFHEELLGRTQGARGLLDRLDLLYLSERARIFGGGDLAFAAARSRAAAPLLDVRWLRVAAALPRRMKLGGRIQREVVARLCPALLDYPIGPGPSLRDRPQRLYWLRAKPGTTYKAFAGLPARTDLREMLAESSGLDLFLDRRERITALATGNPWLFELLLTLHFTISILNEEGVRVEAPDWR